MSRRVGDDELALFGGKEAVGDIDGDALFALGLETIEQQREIRQAEVVLLSGIAVQSRSLVFLDGLGVPQQATSAASWSSKSSFVS